MFTIEIHFPESKNKSIHNCQIGIISKLARTGLLSPMQSNEIKPQTRVIILYTPIVVKKLQTNPKY